jgi:ElaB/YqjD/DUF883 family membrane-anchored ribosome-binding protein
MAKSAEQIEQEVQKTRAQLDETIDRIQDRLSVSGLIDELIGSFRNAEFGLVAEDALAFARRNPMPVIFAAAGVGWLLYRVSQDYAPHSKQIARTPVPRTPAESDNRPRAGAEPPRD